MVGSLALAASPDAFRRTRQLIGLMLLGVALVIILVIVARFQLPAELPTLPWVS